VGRGRSDDILGSVSDISCTGLSANLRHQRIFGSLEKPEIQHFQARLGNGFCPRVHARLV
jgi:hypothetical protein